MHFISGCQFSRTFDHSWPGSPFSLESGDFPLSQDLQLHHILFIKISTIMNQHGTEPWCELCETHELAWFEETQESDKVIGWNDVSETSKNIQWQLDLSKGPVTLNGTSNYIVAKKDVNQCPEGKKTEDKGRKSYCSCCRSSIFSCRGRFVGNFGNQIDPAPADQHKWDEAASIRDALFEHTSTGACQALQSTAGESDIAVPLRHKHTQVLEVRLVSCQEYKCLKFQHTKKLAVASETARTVSEALLPQFNSV